MLHGCINAFDCRLRAQLGLSFIKKIRPTSAYLFVAHVGQAAMLHTTAASSTTSSSRGQQVVKKNKIKEQEQKRPAEWLKNPIGVSGGVNSSEPADDTDWMVQGARIIRSVEAFLGKQYHDI